MIDRIGAPFPRDVERRQLALLLGTIAMVPAAAVATRRGRAATSSAASAATTAADVWHDVAGRSWTMPGGAEGYVCFVAHVTSDEYLTGFRLASPSPAQNEVLLTVSDIADDRGRRSTAIRARSTGDLIYAASRGTDPIEFPAGFGVHVAAGQYLLLNIHVNNPADTQRHGLHDASKRGSARRPM